MKRRALLGTLGTALSLSGCLTLTEGTGGSQSPGGNGQTQTPGTDDTPVASADPTAWTASMRAPGTTEPLLRDGIAYVGSADNNLYALAAPTGEELFRTDVGDEVGPGLAAGGGVVYGTTPDGVFGVDARSGEQVLTAEYNISGQTSPLLADQTLYVPSDELLAVDVDSGETRWTEASASVFGGRPGLVDDVLVTSDGGESATLPSDESYVYGLDPADGSTLWRRHVTADALVSSVGVAADRQTAVLCGRGGLLAAFDVTSGDERWRVRTVSDKSGNVPYRPVVHGDGVYLDTNGLGLRAYDVASGDLLWTREPDSDISSDGTSVNGYGPIEFRDGRLYAVTSVWVEEQEDYYVPKPLQVTVIDPDTGDPATRYSLPTAVEAGTGVTTTGDWALYTTANATVRRARLRVE